MENKKFLTEQIITYLGNKRSLLPYIEKEIKIIQKELNKSKTINVDLFSGSGIVARLMKQYSSTLIVNDMERYSEIINTCYLMNNVDVDWLKYKKNYNQLLKDIKKKWLTTGIIATHYAPKDDSNIKAGERVFYTTRNAQFIDTVRQAIEFFDEPYKTMFMAQLITEASIKTNTAGVFKGFYKNSFTGIGKYGGNGEYALKRIKGNIKINRPVLSEYKCKVKIYREDANKLVKKLNNLDIVYIDPPYNEHPYGSNYFMLNLIIENKLDIETSKISGIPKNWNRSNYNVKRKAINQLKLLIENLDCKYLIVSYNNEGFISYEDMIKLLQKKGKIEVKEIAYNTYRGSRNLSERNLYVKEYLFIVKTYRGDENVAST